MVIFLRMSWEGGGDHCRCSGRLSWTETLTTRRPSKKIMDGDRIDKAAVGVDVTPVRSLNTGAFCNSVSISENGKLVAFVADDKLQLAVSVGNELKSVAVQYKAEFPVKLVRFAPDCQTLAVALANGSVELVFVQANEDGSVVSCKLLRVLVGHVQEIEDMHFVSGFLATCSKEDARVWSLENGSCIQTLPADLSSGLVMRRLRFGSEGRLLFTLQVPKARGGSSFLVVWKRDDNNAPFKLRKIQMVCKFLATSLGVDPQGHFLAVGTAENAVEVFEYATLNHLKRFQKIHGFPSTGLFFAPAAATKSRYLVSTSADKTCTMMSLASFVDQGDGFCFWFLVFFLIFGGLLGLALGLSAEFREMVILGVAPLINEFEKVFS